jgi:hypothetical protein
MKSPWVDIGLVSGLRRIFPAAIAFFAILFMMLSEKTMFFKRPFYFS